MQTQVLKPLPHILFLDSNEEQEIEFLLPNTNEYHSVNVITKQYSYKNNELVSTENKLPIICTFKPSSKVAELSCKRYFISKLIERIKLYLVRKYHFYFSIKTVRKLHLNIRHDIDVFDSTKGTYEIKAKLVVEYFKRETNATFNEEFNFSSCSLLGDIVLDTATTLPPDTWNILKDLISIPRGTIYKFNNNIISFIYYNKEYYFDIETKQLTW